MPMASSLEITRGPQSGTASIFRRSGGGIISR